MHELVDSKIKRTLFLGDEAVIRGALEVGLSFVSTYPGTPASEIGDTLAKIAKEAGIYFEYSANEKVALEVAAGAAFSGLPAMVAMKHYGLNVALDSLLPLVYLECPLVVVVGDDPGSLSSIQAEQDSRWIARLGWIPTLEPADSEEAKEMTKFAFRLAWKYKIPVLIRMTTRVCHARSLVKCNKIVPPKKKGKFVSDPRRRILGSGPAIARHQLLLKKIEKIKKEIVEKTKLNFGENLGQRSLGLITSGVAYYYAQEALAMLNLKLPIFKVGFSFPFPKEKIKKFIKNLESVLIIEEVDPIMEYEIGCIAKEINPKLKIHGKNYLPQVGEVRPEYAIFALCEILQKPLPKELAEQQKIFNQIKIAERPPTLCPGCPHRATFWSVKQAVPKDVIWGGDIGCYLLGALPPNNVSDFNVAMGAGAGICHGISKATDQKPVIFIGDSTFFHAGMPALANLVYNKSNVLFIILDNRITAMTGHQPHPGVGQTGMGEETKALKIEDIARACQADRVEIISAYNLRDSIPKLKEMYQSPGVQVVLSKGDCRLMTIRKMARAGVAIPKFEIIKQSPELEKLKDFGCPAIRKNEKGEYFIDGALCWGCSFCSQIFPENIKIKVSK